MIIVKTIAAIQKISNTAARKIVQERIHDLGGAAFDAAELGYFLVIESGDTIEAITAQVGFAMLCNPFTGILYDQTAFTPSFEFVVKFPACYDRVFVFSDDGYRMGVFMEKVNGTRPELLVINQQFAVQRTN